MFLKNAIEVLDDRLVKRRQDHCCVQFITSVHLSLSRRGFSEDAYTSYLKDERKDENFIHVEAESRNQIQCVVAFRTSWVSRRMRNWFASITNNGMQRYLLCVSSVLLLFRFNTKTDSSGLEYVF